MRKGDRAQWYQSTFLTIWPDLRKNLTKFHPLHTQPSSAMKEKTTRPQLQQNYSLASLWCPEVSWHTVLGIWHRKCHTPHEAQPSDLTTFSQGDPVILALQGRKQPRKRHSVPQVTRSSLPRELRGPGRVSRGSNKTFWENLAGTLFRDPRS